MEIVPQFRSFSYSPFPLLPAPASRLLLSAPKVAGLLPAQVAAPFTDTVLLRDDPMPPPFVSKYRAMMPPEILDIIGHLPAPDELLCMINEIMRQPVTDSAYTRAADGRREWTQ